MVTIEIIHSFKNHDFRSFKFDNIFRLIKDPITVHRYASTIHQVNILYI